MNHSVTSSKKLLLAPLISGLFILVAGFASASHDSSIHACVNAGGFIKVVASGADCKQEETAVVLATEASLASNRLHGNKATVFERNGSGSSLGEVTGVEGILRFCESEDVDCLVLTTGTLTEADDQSVVTFNAANAADFPAIADRLTNGENNWLEIENTRRRPNGDPAGSGRSTGPERSFFFSLTPTQVSAGLDSTHSPFVDLAELEIGSIDISIDALQLNFTGMETDINFQFRVFFGLAN